MTAQSPDLNPSSWFGMYWTDKCRVKAKQLASATHLWELLEQIWEKLSEEFSTKNWKSRGVLKHLTGNVWW